MTDRDWAYLLGWLDGRGTVDGKCNSSDYLTIASRLDHQACDVLKEAEPVSYGMGYIDSVQDDVSSFVLGIDARPDIAQDGDIVCKLGDCPFTREYDPDHHYRHHLWIRDPDFVFDPKEFGHWTWKEHTSSIIGATWKGDWVPIRV